jgi:hypothetical protein
VAPGRLRARLLPAFASVLWSLCSSSCSLCLRCFKWHPWPSAWCSTAKTNPTAAALAPQSRSRSVNRLACYLFSPTCLQLILTKRILQGCAWCPAASTCMPVHIPRRDGDSLNGRQVPARSRLASLLASRSAAAFLLCRHHFASALTPPLSTAPFQAHVQRLARTVAAHYIPQPVPFDPPGAISVTLEHLHPRHLRRSYHDTYSSPRHSWNNSTFPHPRKISSQSIF